MISGQSDEDIGQGESTGAAGHGSSTGVSGQGTSLSGYLPDLLLHSPSCVSMCQVSSSGQSPGLTPLPGIETFSSGVESSGDQYLISPLLPWSPSTANDSGNIRDNTMILVKYFVQGGTTAILGSLQPIKPELLTENVAVKTEPDITTLQTPRRSLLSSSAPKTGQFCVS